MAGCSLYGKGAAVEAKRKLFSDAESREPLHCTLYSPLRMLQSSSLLITFFIAWVLDTCAGLVEGKRASKVRSFSCSCLSQVSTPNAKIDCPKEKLLVQVPAGIPRVGEGFATTGS